MDKIRYSRQIAVPEIGSDGQKKLWDAKVLVIGCGALGSMVAMQLCGAGVGKIGIADFDNVDISNLQRQFFFKTDESGESKAHLTHLRMRALNPEVEVKVYNSLITPKIADELFPKYDFIVDATDNPESKRMTGELALRHGKGCCIAGVREFSGQVMTFLPDSPRFEDFFGNASASGVLPCSLSGVMGPAAALCASIQASEAIKFITGAGKLLSGRLLLFNLLNNTFRTLSF